MASCDDKDVEYINLDKDICITKGAAFKIKKAFTVVNGNNFTVSGLKSKCDSDETKVFDIVRKNALVKVINLNVRNVDIACTMSEGSHIIYQDSVIFNIKSLCGTTDPCKAVILIDSVIIQAHKIITGSSYEKFQATNTTFSDVKKFVSAKVIKDFSLDRAEVSLLPKSKGIFSSKQQIEKYSITKSKITGGLADNSALFSLSATASSHGLIKGNTIILEKSPGATPLWLTKPEPASGPTFVFRAEPACGPINRVLSATKNFIQSDDPHLISIHGNSHPRANDKFLITNNTLTTNEASAVLSVNNFNVPNPRTPELPKGYCLFSKNIVVGNTTQSTRGSAVSINNSEGVSVSDNTLSNFKAAAVEIDASSTTFTKSLVFLGSNDIQNSASAIRNQSKDTAGLPNALYANATSSSGEAVSLTKTVPS